MSTRWRSLLVSAALVVGLALVHELLAFAVADADVVAAVLVQRDAGTALALLTLVLVRLALVLIAPGWLLFTAVRGILR